MLQFRCLDGKRRESSSLPRASFIHASFPIITAARPGSYSYTPVCSRILATSASRTGDYQELTVTTVGQALGMVVCKSAVLAAAEAMIEYNEWEDRRMKKLAIDAELALARGHAAVAANGDVDNEEDEEEEEFDVESFVAKHKASCIKYLYKNLSTESIKRIYEVIARQIVSPRHFERLTKDPIKSAARKMLKYQSRFTAGNRMWPTFLWSKVILYASFFTYDALLAVVEYLGEPKRKAVKVRRVLAWIGKKVGALALIMAGTATGFTVGFYISPGYGGHIGPILGEVAASAVVAEFLS